MKTASFLLIALLLATSAAKADPVPDYMLQKDYDNCMGGDHDPQRAQYCQCVKEAMSSWDLDTYNTMAQQQQQAGNTQATPALEEIAKACIEKILH